MTRRSPAPGYPEAAAVGDHLVIDKTEWIPGADPEPHRRDPDQATYPESYVYCLRCGVEALRTRDLPPTCDADRPTAADPTDGAPAAVPKRSLRAITESMRVVREALDLYTVVGESGSAYTVDLRGEPACTCPDFQYRDSVAACKHVRRARLVAGETDVAAVRAHLAASADGAETEADRLMDRATDLRTTADDLRAAVERLDDLAVEGLSEDGTAAPAATDEP